MLERVWGGERWQLKLELSVIIVQEGKLLEEFLAAMFKKRNPYPPFPLGAAEACRKIDKASKKYKKWKHWPDKEKGYVKDLIQYNIGDCRSTWLIAKRLGNAYS